MEQTVDVSPELPLGAAWIDELSDEQCMEVFWLYVEQPDEFLAAHPAPLLGAAMRYALRAVFADNSSAPVARPGDSLHS